MQKKNPALKAFEVTSALVPLGQELEFCEVKRLRLCAKGIWQSTALIVLGSFPRTMRNACKIFSSGLFLLNALSSHKRQFSGIFSVLLPSPKRVFSQGFQNNF